MIQTNVITPLRQRLQNCGSSLSASDFKALLDTLELLEKNINEGIGKFITEAPKDGKKYVRTDGTWVPLDCYETNEELIEKIINFKGYWSSVEELNDYYYTDLNKKGWYAWVGTPYPGEVYVVLNDATEWVNTGQVPSV